jgi:hypothetical protein
MAQIALHQALSCSMMNFAFKWKHEDGSIVEFSAGGGHPTIQKTDWMRKMNNLSAWFGVAKLKRETCSGESVLGDRKYLGKGAAIAGSEAFYFQSTRIWPVRSSRRPRLSFSAFSSTVRIFALHQSSTVPPLAFACRSRTNFSSGSRTSICPNEKLSARSWHAPMLPRYKPGNGLVVLIRKVTTKS